MKFDKAAMQKRREELDKQAADIKEKAAPLRLERDKHVQKARAKEDALNAAIKDAEQGLYDIEMERAFLARGLGARSIAAEAI